MAKKKKGYKQFIGFIYIGVSAILIYTLGMNVYRVVVQNQKLTVLQAQKNNLEKEKKELSREIELLNDSDYVARYARDNYIFSTEGEEVVKLPDSKK